jgi:hypothetical protein
VSAPALTVSHQIAAPLQVVPDELGNKAQTLAIAIKHLDVVDAATHEAGTRMLLESHQALKDLEAARVKFKKPITELGKAIDTVVANLADPLDLAKKSMQGKVAKYEAAEKAKADAIRREAEEKAAKERAEAEHERARLQAEADEKHRQEIAAAEAKAKQEAAELAEILGKPVEAKPVEVAPAPKIELPATPAPAPVAVIEPAKPSAVQVRNIPVLVIDDPKLVPAYVGGQELRTIDRAAVKRAIEAGATVPGARIEMQPQTAMARQR